MIISDPDPNGQVIRGLDSTGQAITNPDPDPACQVIKYPDPTGQIITNPDPDPACQVINDPDPTVLDSTDPDSYTFFGSGCIRTCYTATFIVGTSRHFDLLKLI